MTDSGSAAGEPVTVVVADDQSAVREGLVLLLGTLPGITVAGQAADGDAAVDLVAATRPAGRADGPEHARLRRRRRHRAGSPPTTRAPGWWC